MEGDRLLQFLTFYQVYFYPRPPGGGRRYRHGLTRTTQLHFYPRPPGGGRHHQHSIRRNTECISIHALRVEGDANATRVITLSPKFLSTPSGWRATLIAELWTAYLKAFLSTPSGWRATVLAEKRALDYRYFYPRPPGGGRPRLLFYSSPPSNFYPRPPGGGRRYRHGLTRTTQLHFYPRPPGGGRHHQHSIRRNTECISIHALRVEGDLAAQAGRQRL